MGTIADYHKTRSVLDMKFIEAVFLQDDRELLESVRKQHPNAIIRMPGWEYPTSGYKGSVPSNWNEEVIQL